jgi:two-component system, LuxR family, sensor kinase FixL
MPDMPPRPQNLTEDSLFQTLMATAVDGIVVIDAHGTVSAYNAACERLFGYQAGEVLGRNVKMLMPSPYREEHDGYLQRYQATGEPRIIGIGREVTGQCKDGSTFPMYLSVGEGAFNGQKIYVGIIHDTTTREISRKRLSELQMELLHVSRLSDMSQMTAALAHELNQPLTAIMNYVKAARRTLTGADDPRVAKAQELIDKAADQTARAGKIIRHLRDFIEKRETVRSREDLNQIAEEALALGFIGAADLNVKIRTELTAKLPPVLIDKVQIQQVIINLVRNSIEAMQSAVRRELSVTTRKLDGELLEVAVADTGPGLSAEVSSRLFQPFITTKEKGMGIGLTICQSIVEAHGGRIWASPREEGGVIFHFTLPPADG